MMKTAVFVEGQTELIFVRQLLLTIFEYQNISLECFTLFTDSRFHPTEYAYLNDSADFFFQIINVGNDQSVLTRIKRREKTMLSAGFSRIIGLRDMYSKDYREAVKNHVIDKVINQKFIDGHNAQIQSDRIFFSFAIMEIEAWLLGLYRCFEKMNDQLTSEFIEQYLGFNLVVLDPEEQFFHPAEEVAKIFALVGAQYRKSKGEINAVVSYVERKDYIELLDSSKCASFKTFFGFLKIPGFNYN